MQQKGMSNMKHIFYNVIAVTTEVYRENKYVQIQIE
jgi:hypothetical protein